MTSDAIPGRKFRRKRAGSRQSGAGFSLVELVIVVAILFFLVTMYLSGGSRGYQERQMRVCEQNLQTIYVAVKTYSMDNNDHLPSLASGQTSEPVLSQLVPRYTTGTEYFICPGCNDKKLPDAQPFADRKISYAYYMGHLVQDGASQPLMSDRQVNTNPKLQGQPLFSADGKKPGSNHNKYGGNVMFCDGTVQSSPAASAFNLTNAPGVVLLNPRP